MVGVVPSIEMVIWVAVGGRSSLYGALVGTLLVNLAKDSISSEWPDAWLYVMGFLFIAVVVATPRGLAGIVESARARLGRPKLGAPSPPATKLAREPVREPIAETISDVEVSPHG
jgi:hypothetical protein